MLDRMPEKGDRVVWQGSTWLVITALQPNGLKYMTADAKLINKSPHDKSYRQEGTIERVHFTLPVETSEWEWEDDFTSWVVGTRRKAGC